MTWGERIDTRLHAKDSAAQECMAIVRELAAERDTLQGLLKKSLEREEQIEKELSEARAQVAVLRGAMETLSDTIDDQIPLGGYCEEIGLDIDDKLEPWASLFDAKGKADEALITTPAEAAERAKAIEQKLAAARGQVVLLHGALFLVRDEIDKYGSQADLAWLLESAEEALSATPAEAAERVQKLAELLQDAVSETENAERLSKGFCSAAKAALSEWRRDK